MLTKKSVLAPAPAPVPALPVAWLLGVAVAGAAGVNCVVVGALTPLVDPAMRVMLLVVLLKLLLVPLLPLWDGERGPVAEPDGWMLTECTWLWWAGLPLPLPLGPKGLAGDNCCCCCCCCWPPIMVPAPVLCGILLLVLGSGA